MAITTMDAWDTGKSVNSGNEPNAPTDGVYSTKDAQALQQLLADIVATLDELKGQL